MNKSELISYLDNIMLVIVSGLLLALPLFFLTNTTDLFVMPKQVLVILATIVLLIAWGVKMVAERKITIRTNPFNLPVFLFGTIILVSSILSPNLFDSLTQSIPVLFTLFLFFIMVNSLNNRNYFSIALSALAIGAVLSALVSILYYFKIYVLPFPAIQNQYFNPFGSPIQQIAYYLPILVLSSIYVYRKYRSSTISDITKDYSSLILVASSFLLLGGIILTVIKIVSLPQKPIVLPMRYGFQIALASVGQDSARMILSFLFGSGYGTFLNDFARFRISTFNLEQNIWNLNFSYSSSLIFELMATTGILGILAFIFILIRVIRTRTYPINPLFVALICSFVLSLLIPYSFSLIFLMFVLLAFHAAYLYLEDDKRVYNVSLSLIALRDGLINVSEEGHQVHPSRRSNAALLPASVLVLIVLMTGFVGLFTVKETLADTKFAQSLEQASLNNGQLTYDLQRQALDPNITSLSSFPYKSDYFRLFSQVNLALANSIATNIPHGSSPSAQTQQTIVGLMQQSINSARAAAQLAPMTYTNWDNLGGVYRSLIGVGQNADQFSIASLNQAIALDPSDPRLYIERGGIFYQLGQYDQAQNDFQIAVQLKRDYANAYYNLGHALEQKGQLQDALAQYQAVAQLVQSDKQSLDQINKEIDALKTKIGSQASGQNSNAPIQGNAQNQGPLEVNQPSTTLPAQSQEVKLPPPPAGENTKNQTQNTTENSTSNQTTNTTK